VLALNNQVLALKKDLEAAEQEVASLEAAAHLVWSAASQQMTEQGQVRSACAVWLCGMQACCATGLPLPADTSIYWGDLS
jgi:uncharacterized protein (DUF3084 family)